MAHEFVARAELLWLITQLCCHLEVSFNFVFLQALASRCVTSGRPGRRAQQDANMMLSFRSILWLMPLCHATVPAECDGDDKFPTLSFAYTLQWDMLDWNRSDGRITSSSGSAIFIKLLQRNELFVDDPHGRVMWMGIGSGPDAEYYVCGFDANNKKVFECAHRGLDYLMVFDIVDFVAGACEVDTFEFVGVRRAFQIKSSTCRERDLEGMIFCWFALAGAPWTANPLWTARAIQTTESFWRPRTSHLLAEDTVSLA